jgi:hypothetical protein
MDQKALVGAIVAVALVGVVLIGRIALSRLKGQEIKAKAATFSVLVVLVALIGLAAGSGVLERLLGW